MAKKSGISPKCDIEVTDVLGSVETWSFMLKMFLNCLLLNIVAECIITRPENTSFLTKKTRLHNFSQSHLKHEKACWLCCMDECVTRA